LQAYHGSQVVPGPEAEHPAVFVMGIIINHISR
jgi:hypothetical protein